MSDASLGEGSLVAIRRYMFWGGLFACGLVVCVGFWLMLATISGAVIASGSVTVLSDVKQVQTSADGVVVEIKVRNGQRVTAGEPLLLLDNTVARSRFAVAERLMIELDARQSRLTAERDGQAAVVFGIAPIGSVSPATLKDIRKTETRLFELRKSTHEGRKALLVEQIAQIEQEVAGYLRQIESNAAQQTFIARELEGARTLWSQKLIPLEQVSSLEREAARLDGERGRLEAAVAQMSGKSAELELTVQQVDKELFSEVALELRDVDTQMMQMEEQYIAAKDELDKLVVAAPNDGIVHQLQIKTVGGYLVAGEVVMLIVPTSDELVVEARLSPTDIDQVRIGSEARLLFPAFNQRITPELGGRVDYVSADTAIDQQTGAIFYSVRVSVPQQEIRRLGEFSLVPGMPVEVFIKTGDRRVVSILTKPIFDQLNKAFRQD